MDAISEAIKSTFSTREKVLCRALEIVCKMLRENPMGDLGLYPADLIFAVPGGNNQDPNGEKYVSYFLSHAVKELKEEGEL